MGVLLPKIGRSAAYILCLFIFSLSISVINAQVALKEFKRFKYSLDQDFLPLGSEGRKEEGKDILDLQDGITDAQIRNMNYWNASYPTYRWHQIMMEISDLHRGHKNGGRVVILHLAMYDALIEAWEHKYKYQIKAPYRENKNIQILSRDRGYSTFICEWSAAAGAAEQIMTYYFPDSQGYLDSLLTQFKKARLTTGLQLPSDIETGINIGRQIALKYIDYAKKDRTDKVWEGQVPQSESLWTGDPGKWDPMKRQWRPLTLTSPDQFRPGPPPSDWTEDMEELRRFNATHKTSAIAWKWRTEPVWDRLLERKILEYDLGPLEAAFAGAVFHTARFDGIIAAWDGKYHYWGIRPFQYDPDFKPILVDTPNFPGYPAGHTTVAGSIATVLSLLFPQDEAYFMELAKECSESRFEGGVHFRTDNEIGLTVGYQVGDQVIKAFLNRS